MKKINKETLRLSAQKMMFDMSDEQYDTLLDEFEIVISQMELISNIKGIENVEPMTFPFPVKNSYLREDIPGEPLSNDDATKNSGDVVEGQIRLPKVVG